MSLLACFSSLVLALSFASQAQVNPGDRRADSGGSSSLQLEEVLASVEAHYPLIIGAGQDLIKARSELLAARGGFDPVLKSAYQATPSGEYENRYFDTVLEQPTPAWGTRLFAGYRNGRGRFGPYDERLLTNSEGEVRGGLELPLLRGGLTDERRIRIETSRRGLEASEAQLDSQRLESRRQASHRYFDWVAAGEKLKVAQALQRLAVERDRAMEHRVLKGDAAKIDQTDNQRSVVQREAAIVAAHRALEKAALELSLFYRDSSGRPILATHERLPARGLSPPLASEPELVASSKVLAQGVLPRHPDVLRLQAQVGQNEAEKRLARNSVLPKLDAEFAVSQDLGGGGGSKSILEYKTALKLEFPILFRAPRGRLEAVSAQSAKLDAQLELARDRILVAIEDAVQAIDAARRRVEMARQEVALSVKVEDAEKVRFRHGDSNILTVNLREQATADARSRSIDALADYHRAHADLAAAAATELRAKASRD